MHESVAARPVSCEILLTVTTQVLKSNSAQQSVCTETHTPFLQPRPTATPCTYFKSDINLDEGGIPLKNITHWAVLSILIHHMRTQRRALTEPDSDSSSLRLQSESAVPFPIRFNLSEAS